MESSVLKLDYKNFINIGFIASCVSVINILVFYNTFNFNPLPYFSVSEIIFQFVKDTIVGIIGLVLFLYIYLMLIKRNAYVFTKFYNFLAFRNRKSFIYTVSTLCLVFIIELWVLVAFDNFPVSLATIASISTGTLTIFILLDPLQKDVSRIELENDLYFTNEAHSINFVIYAFATILVLQSSIFSLLKSQNVLKKNMYYNSLIVLNDERKIRIHQKLRLIGKSNGYVFVYNTTNKFTMVIPRENIKEEHLHRLEDFDWAFAYPF